MKYKVNRTAICGGGTLIDLFAYYDGNDINEAYKQLAPPLIKGTYRVNPDCKCDFAVIEAENDI